MTGHFSCCVVNCPNNWINSKCKFFSFPNRSNLLDQRKKWVDLIKRKNPDGSDWSPKNERICSEHFINGTKSHNPSHPNYLPTIFPSIYKNRKRNSQQILERYERIENCKRRKFTTSSGIQEVNKNVDLGCSTKQNISCEQFDTDSDSWISTVESDVIVQNSEQSSNHSNNPDMLTAVNFCYEPAEAVAADHPMQDITKKTKSVHCQVNFVTDSDDDSNNFSSSRYVINNVCEAGTQTDICSKKPLQKCDQMCNTEEVKKRDMGVGTEDNFLIGFRGYEQLKDDDQHTDLMGVRMKVFDFLLSRSPVVTGCAYKINNKNRLLIFLMILKTGLSFSAVGVLFNVNRKTISRIFYEYLDHLSQSLSNLIFWPNKDVVQGVMPECFKENFGDTRVILDCTEFHMEIPSGLDNRVFCYSSYKRGFTAKLLLGILPTGFISFKSKLAGGRKSDSQITVESGLLDLLDEGDVVLADKGFPEVTMKLQEDGKKAFIVMPPFLEKKMSLVTKRLE